MKIGKILALAAFGNRRTTVVPWWVSPKVYAAYKADGATDIANSFLDVTGHGYNLSLGITPTWDAVNGWKYNGSSYLKTGVGPPLGASWSMIVQFSGGTNVLSCLLGTYKTSGGFNEFAINNRHSTAAVAWINGGTGANVTKSPRQDSGMLAIAGKTAWRSGFLDATIAGGLSTVAPLEMYIGALNQDGSPTQNTLCYIQRVAIYSDILTGNEIRKIYYNLNPSVQPLLVTFGDSVTSGQGASDAAHRWANIVAANYPTLTLSNQGVSGTVLQNTVQNTVAVIGGPASTNGRDTYFNRIIVTRPEKLFILYGLNDLRLNDPAFSDTNFANDLSEVVDFALANGTLASDIVIGSPPYIPEASYALSAPYNGGSRAKHAAYTAACQSVASAKNTRYADVYGYMTDHGGDSLISIVDGIHPNDSGHATIATAMLAAG